MGRLRSVTTLAGASVVGLVLSACSSGEGETSPEKDVSGSAMEVASPTFAEGESIPAKYTCEGQDVSPPLRLGRTPEGTRSIAIVVDDPDAPGGTFVHWVLFGMPPDTTELSEDYAGNLRSGARHGTNDFGNQGYGGPCPPRGSPPRYVFKVYAVDRETGLEAGATKADLLRELEGSILAVGQLMGTYQRR